MDYDVNIFYAEGLLSGNGSQGQHVGFAQDLSKKYPGITDHVHVDVRSKNKVVPPNEIFAQCF